MPRLPFVSVIVPVLRESAALAECLAAITSQNYPAARFEIFLVGNGPEPLPLTHPRVRVLHEPIPGSYAARNRGLRAARGTVLAFTDADCRPHSDWLRHGVRALADRDFVGGRVHVVPQDNTAIALYEQHATFDQKRFLERWHFAATANLFVRKSVMAAVGPFDAGLKSAGDFEWGQRATRAGFAASYEEKACVDHASRNSLRGLIRQHRRLVGGFYQVAWPQAVPLWQRGSLLWQGLVPSSRALSRTLLADRTVSLPHKVKLVGLVSVLAAVRGVELTRLARGGAPCRE